MNDPRNPFLDDSALNQPLETSTLTEIFHAAYRLADARALSSGDEAIDLEIGSMCRAVRRNQFDAWPLHPATIGERRFGVTTTVLMAIEALYCDQIGRSIASVMEIMRGFAMTAGVEPLDPIAVWAICAYFAQRRSIRCKISMVNLNTDWCVATVRLPLQVSSKTDRCFEASTTCVMDVEQGQVIAFRTAPSDTEIGALCLYDAIISQRQPSATDRSGLTWPMPRRVLPCSASLAEALQKSCRELPFVIGAAALPPKSAAEETLTRLNGEWHRSLQKRVLSAAQFEQIFDNYLWRFHGHGPRRSNDELAKTFAHLRGYSQDPLEVFPVLRKLLSRHDSQIADGVVHHAGLDYEHAYLELWPGRKVSLVQSQTAEAHAWIYFGEHVICKASAIQLRRRDGTYRPNRERI